jgi:hypothetical protein
MKSAERVALATSWEGPSWVFTPRNQDVFCEAKRPGSYKRQNVWPSVRGAVHSDEKRCVLVVILAGQSNDALSVLMSRDNSEQCLDTGWTTAAAFLAGTDFFCRNDLEPVWSPVQWPRRAISCEVKRPEKTTHIHIASRLLVAVTTWYRTKCPMHCDHFKIYFTLQLSSNHSLFIHYSCLDNNSRYT